MKINFLLAPNSEDKYVATVSETEEDAISIHDEDVNLKDGDSIRLAIELIEKMELITIGEAMPMTVALTRAFSGGVLPYELEEQLCSEQYLEALKRGAIAYLKDSLDEIVEELQKCKEAQDNRMSDLADEYIKRVVYPAYIQHGADVSQLKDIKDVLVDYSKWLLNK